LVPKTQQGTGQGTRQGACQCSWERIIVQAVQQAVLRAAATRAGVAVAALAVALAFGGGVRPAAAAEAPWCIVDYEGNYHCYYNSFAECHQTVLGGSRGFCNVNPSAPAAAAASTAVPARRR
jgi:hypothetical protein